MISEAAVRAIHDFPSLAEFLHRELGWPIPANLELDEMVYEFSPEDLGLAEEDCVRLKHGCVRQLRPLSPHQPWGVFILETQARRVHVTSLRRLLRALVPSRRQSPTRTTWNLPNLLFVCTPDYQEFTFAHFTGDKPHNAKLTTFGWSPEEPCRTLCEFNLPDLRWPEDPQDAQAWSAKWAGAFDVEKVTKRFFGEYHDLFGSTKAQIQGLPDDEARHEFTQALFNRLLFIAFVQKKGWLRFNGHTDYLNALWDTHRQEAGPKGNFYRDRLKPLFFAGLSTPNGVNIIGINRGGALTSVIGEVPYLNGGLFEENDSDRDPEIVVPDDCIGAILASLFSRYNFTVTESTPLDVEVAVDPEMLGKVFEELVTGRHESGSYYTPRGIVAFMCREAIKGYLGGHEALVDARDASDITVPQARQLLRRLQAVRVVDPACGSGAYLLGMLHELHELTRLLDTRAEQATARDDYQRKLAIIRNNLYGVDIDPFAVNIARLRLWLALAVEFQGDTPEPLPNLDFKVEVGDSLSAPDPQGGAQPDMFRQQQIGELERKKAEYADPYYQASKADLKRQIAALKAEIAAWTHKGKAVQGFDWRVEFAEVFEPQEPVSTIGGAFNFGQELAERAAPGGFDIVVENPPYVRHELIKGQKPTLKAVYPEVYAGTADLYCYFYARSLQLLRPGGMLGVISSNKWLRAAYGASLRKHIAETCLVESVTDFGDLPVFESATAYPMVFVGQRRAGLSQPIFTQVATLDPPYPDVRAVVIATGQRLSSTALDGSVWTLAVGDAGELLPRLAKVGKPLKQVTGSRLYRGITTGFNRAFVIDNQTRERLILDDARSCEVVRPLAMGRDVGRWAINSEDRWLILTKIGVDIERYPAILAYLAQWQDELERRQDKGEHWWELRACSYYDAFEQPKIVSTKVSIRPTFALDTQKHYLGNTAYFMPVKGDGRFLLGILNSDAFCMYAKEVFVQKQNGWYEVQPTGLEAFPIPEASPADRAAIAELVQKCMDARGEGCEEWEREIDERVAVLYGL